MYKQILALHLMCEDRSIPHTITRLYDGYKIEFPRGEDIVQHFGSYRADEGYVEPAGFGDEYDYQPQTLATAWGLILEQYGI